MSSDLGQSPQPDPSTSERLPFLPGLIVTNLIKLGGLVVALNEALIEPAIRPGALGIAALMMAGAQSLETFLTAFFGAGKK